MIGVRGANAGGGFVSPRFGPEPTNKSSRHNTTLGGWWDRATRNEGRRGTVSRLVVTLFFLLPSPSPSIEPSRRDVRVPRDYVCVSFHLFVRETGPRKMESNAAMAEGANARLGFLSFSSGDTHFLPARLPPTASSGVPRAFA
uniref:Uncharacterized protein n=1 Tax=Anopheles atroparvus TaxID=41427 RepID=A0AAG5DAT6_ANOAO